jgi:hypothetical protein
MSAAFLPSDVVVVSTNGQLQDSKATFKATSSNAGTKSATKTITVTK